MRVARNFGYRIADEDHPVIVFDPAADGIGDTDTGGHPHHDTGCNPILRSIVSSSVFAKPPKPFFTTSCSFSWGLRSSMICAPQVPSTQCVRLPLPGSIPKRQYRNAASE